LGMHSSQSLNSNSIAHKKNAILFFSFPGKTGQEIRSVLAKVA